MKLVNLVQMRPGQTGKVREIQGGYGLVRRTQAMGIREGKRITKLSSQFWRGPVTVGIDNLQIAIGHGMAGRIMVEVGD